jgi:hypothetical protein
MQEVSSIFLNTLSSPLDSGLSDKSISAVGCTFACNKEDSTSENDKLTTPGNNTAQTRKRENKNRITLSPILLSHMEKHLMGRSHKL